MSPRSKQRQRTHLAALLMLGLNAKQIATQLGLSLTQVYRLIKAYGLQLNKQPRGGHLRGNSVAPLLNPFTDAEIRAMLTQHGNSVAGLARYLGASKGGLYSALAKRGIHSTNPQGIPRHRRPQTD